MNLNTPQGRSWKFGLPIVLTIDSVFSVIALLAFSGAFTSFLRAPRGEPRFAENDLAFELLFILIYACTGILLIVRWKATLKLFRLSWLLWVLPALAAVSIIWSESPAISARRWVALAGSMMFGLYLAVRYPLPEQMRLMRWTLGFAVVASIGFALLFPEHGVMTDFHLGSWQGIFPHKNSLARMMLLAGLVYLLHARRRRSAHWLLFAMVGLAGASLLFSNSATGYVAVAFTAVLILVGRALQRSFVYAASILAFLIPAALGAAAWGSMNPTISGELLEIPLGALGKDATLTGRTELWGAIGDLIEKRPWLGYGFSGFWNGWDGPSARIWEQIEWLPGHAHNGYLDLWLELGVIGLVLFGLILAVMGARSVNFARSSQSPEALFPLTFWGIFIILNIVTVLILQRNDFFWVLFVMVYVTLSRGDRVPRKAKIKLNSV